MATHDPWNIGTLHKDGIWAYYVASNYVGVFLCAVLMYSVQTNPKKTSTDILIAGLCSGCLLMSITCGTQCLVNVVHGKFYGGPTACQIEAIAHVSSILTQFFCVAGIALRSYLLVVRKYDLSVSTASKCTFAVWFLCCLLTGLFSLFSPIYLMSNGTYCFFGFSSFAIAGWLVPGLIIALGVMIFCYYKIWREFRRTGLILEAAMMMIGQNSKATIELTPMDDDSSSGRGRSKTKTAQLDAVRRDISHIQVARRSALFVIILLLGWGFAAITAIYELSVGHATEWLVTAVGVGGVSFSWWVPLTYAYTSEWHKSSMKKLFGWMCIPCLGEAWWRGAWEGSKGSKGSKRPPHSPESTNDSNDNSLHRLNSSHSPMDGSITPRPLPLQKNSNATPCTPDPHAESPVKPIAEQPEAEQAATEALEEEAAAVAALAAKDAPSHAGDYVITLD